MYCSKCGKKNTDNAKFCDKCGNCLNVSEVPLTIITNTEKTTCSDNISNYSSNNRKIIIIVATVILAILIAAGISITISKKKSELTTTQVTKEQSTTSSTSQSTTEQNSTERKLNNLDYPSQYDCITAIEKGYSTLFSDISANISISHYETSYSKTENTTEELYHLEWTTGDGVLDMGTIRLLLDSAPIENEDGGITIIGHVSEVSCSLNLPNTNFDNDYATYVYKLACVPVYIYSNKWRGFNGTFNDFFKNMRKTKQMNEIIYYNIPDYPYVTGTYSTSTIACSVEYSES